MKIQCQGSTELSLHSRTAPNANRSGADCTNLVLNAAVSDDQGSMYPPPDSDADNRPPPPGAVFLLRLPGQPASWHGSR